MNQKLAATAEAEGQEQRTEKVRQPVRDVVGRCGGGRLQPQHRSMQLHAPACGAAPHITALQYRTHVSGPCSMHRCD